jgi:type IV pilus assembly protein PilW
MSTNHGPARPDLRQRCGGVGLIELLVAVAIGLVMIAGAVTVYAKAKDAYAALDANARLQETARYAMGLIEADIRMASFWGLTNRPDLITANASLTFPNKCGGAAWITDVQRFIDGTNNAYLSVTNCAAVYGGAQADSDVLVLRRASAQRIAPQAAVVTAANQDRVLIVTSRLAGQVFVPKDIGNAIPPGYATADVAGQPPLADTRRLVVNAYYVSADSSVATGYPALRRKTLVAGPTIQDDEIIPGVEDLQFQVGVDTSGDANVDAYFNPGSIPAGGTPVSVRVWLRLRAQDRDAAYLDNQPYEYADRTVSAPNDPFRRLLYAKTIHLRNARR